MTNLKFDEKFKKYQIGALFENRNKEKVFRIYFHTDYTVEDYKINYNYEDEYLRYQDDSLCDRNFDSELSVSNLSKDKYSGTFGYGANVLFQKLELFYGLKFSGFYGDYFNDEFYESIDYTEDIYTDTTVIDSSFVEYSYFSEGKEYEVSASFPLGAKYNLGKKVSLYFGLGYKITRNYIKFVEGESFFGWDTDSYQNLGLEFNPIQRLVIGIDFAGSLYNYKYWHLDIKYFF